MCIDADDDDDDGADVVLVWRFNHVESSLAKHRHWNKR